MKRIIIIFIFLLLISTGCEKEVTQDNPEKAIETPTIDEEKDVDNDIVKKFYVMVRDKKSSDDLMRFLDENIEKVQSKEKQNEMLDTMFEGYRQETMEIGLDDFEKWIKYCEKYIYNLDFNNQQDIDKIEDIDSEFKAIVQDGYDKGYKFMWWGGTLWIVPDYRMLLDKYSNYMSEPLHAYVSTYADIIHDPIFEIKGYTYESEIPKDMIELLVGSDVVIERMLRLEKVLDKYSDLSFTWDMKMLYEMHLGMFLETLPVIIEDENELIEIYSSYKVEYQDTNLAPYMDEYIELLKSDSFIEYKKACERDINTEGRFEFREKVLEIIQEIRQKYN